MVIPFEAPLSNILQINVSNIVFFLFHYRFIKGKRLSLLSFAKANGNVSRFLMKDYINQLDKILDSLDANILMSAFKISHKEAVEKAKLEYENIR